MRFIKSAAIGTNPGTGKQLVEISKTIVAEAGRITSFDFLVNLDVYEIRTIYAKSDNDNPIVLSIFDNKNGGQEIYRSLSQAVVNDIAMVPCKDKSGNKELHIQVNNPGTNTIHIELAIKLTSL